MGMKTAEKTKLEQAIVFLAGKCDHASTLDGQGFSAYDTDFGHGMADRVLDDQPLSEKMWEGMRRLAQKYRKQLEKADYDIELVLDCEMPERVKYKTEAPVEGASDWSKLDGAAKVLVAYDEYLGLNKSGKMHGFRAAYTDKDGKAQHQEFWFPKSLIGGSKDAMVVPLWLVRDRNLHRIIPGNLKAV